MPRNQFALGIPFAALIGMTLGRDFPIFNEHAVILIWKFLWISALAEAGLGGGYGLPRQQKPISVAGFAFLPA